VSKRGAEVHKRYAFETVFNYAICSAIPQSLVMRLILFK